MKRIKIRKMFLAWTMASAMAVQGAAPAMAGYSAVKNREQEQKSPIWATMSDAVKEARATPGDAWDKSSIITALVSQGAKVLGLRTSATGDLWDGWESNMDFPGSGTQQEPYQILGLAHLMGLSEAVAAGIDFQGKYFELAQDIDLGNLERNNGSWNPIGWYQNEEEIGDKVSHGFSGTFDGCGNTIWGLKIHMAGTEADYAGLFGLIDGGTVHNLRIEDAQVYAGDKAGILAGAVTGGACIRDVFVSGYVRASGDAGGITGTAEGKGSRVLIENCRGEGISILSEGGSSFTGGIAGQAVEADLIDNVVITQDGNSDRIQGKGYTGGIAGRMREAHIYNSYVDGTIGGNGAKAVGGIAGLYESGNLILARFAGDIGRTNNGSMAREGTFVGMRQGTFTYGTEKENNLSYLFTNTAGKAKTVFGSGENGDNIFTQYAHIGYWTDHGTKYVTVAGVTETGCQDRYFYEELEDGVRYLMTQKLDEEFEGDLDHFAPGYQGEPVRGYLLSVPRIDARNANGTYDTDVASLSAIPTGVNTYYRTIDKDHSGAVAPGTTVSVATSAKNSGGNRYQMVMDNMEPGGVVPPVYIDERGETLPMTYVNGGSYSFEMPACDTEIRAEYVKVTTKLEVDPESTVIAVTQTRSGDRKNPQIVTEVRNQSGILVARYINGNQDTAVEVQPIRIHGEHNEAGSTADRAVMWSVDDADLLIHTSTPGYTLEDARIMPNLEGTFIQGILNREVKKQADSQYEEAISPVIYEQTAVLTAASNPETSADNIPVYGNCKVTVTLQILDQTTRRVEGLNLSHGNLDCTITRTLKGDRKNPEETITSTVPFILTADLFPKQPFYKNVSWKDEKSGQILVLTPSGDHQENVKIDLRYDPEGKANPAWIQNVIQADNQIKKEDPYKKLEGNAVYEEVVTAVAEDQTHGVVSAPCNVTIHFVTEDQTVIVPEQVKAEHSRVEYELSVAKKGDYRTPAFDYEGFKEKPLKADVFPDCPSEAGYMPYNREVIWSTDDIGTLAVSKNGTILPVKESSWVWDTVNAASMSADKKAEATRTIQVQAKAAGSQAEDMVEVVLHLIARDQTTRYRSSGTGGSSGGSSGSSGSSDRGPGVEGIYISNGAGVPKTSVTGLNIEEGQGKWNRTTEGYWTFTMGGRVFKDEWAYIQNPYADTAKGQNTFDWFRFDEKGHMVTGWYTDKDGHQYYLNPVSDNTKGRMMVGWNWISGDGSLKRCYYFQEQSDGYKGSLFKNKMTPDGYAVDKDGAWVVKNEVQTK